MSGRVSYLGGIVKDGLVLDLDAGKLDSYNRLGTTWNDISGGQNNGTLVNFSNPSPQTIWDSNNGGSIIFDGTNDYVNTSDIPFRFGTTFTISVWFYWNGVSVSKNILSKRNGSPYNQYGILISNDLVGNPGNKISFFAREDGSGGFSDTYFQYTLPSVGIYNAVGVMNTTSQNFYVNGVLTGSSANNYTSKTFNITGRNLLVGAALDETGTGILGPFNNKIYKAQVYNRALSTSEVLQNYNALKGRYI